jgi:ribulose-5-phosphate 4-epimerase/fuculose-1-phosphate aldolase
MQNPLFATLSAARDRLARQGLLAPEGATVSLRDPASATLLLLDAAGREALQCPIENAAAKTGAAAAHAAIYRLRGDVGAIAAGGGYFGAALADFGGRLPQIFDEQARHLGRMGAPARTVAALAPELRQGGNAVLLEGLAVCLGVNCARMLHNAELFEKCAKAYVLAAASGARVGTLPWWVQRIVHGRLRRDERRAAQRIARGLLAEEARGY